MLQSLFNWHSRLRTAEHQRSEAWYHLLGVSRKIRPSLTGHHQWLGRSSSSVRQVRATIHVLRVHRQRATTAIRTTQGQDCNIVQLKRKVVFFFSFCYPNTWETIARRRERVELPESQATQPSPSLQDSEVPALGGGEKTTLERIWDGSFKMKVLDFRNRYQTI